MCGCGAGGVCVDEVPRKFDQGGHVDLDEFGIARPIDRVEPVEVAELGVVDQDVDRTAGGCSLPERPRATGLAKICDDDRNIHAFAGGGDCLQCVAAPCGKHEINAKRRELLRQCRLMRLSPARACQC